MANNPNPTRISAPAWRFWEEFLAFEPQAKLGGIYADKSGYHNYRADLPSTDYSVEEVANDRVGPSQYASAIDLTLTDSDMVLYTKRLDAAYRRRDARLFIDGEPVTREFIGTLDNKVVYCYMLTGGKAQGVGSDSGVDWGRDTTHLWHVHVSIIRKFCNTWRAWSGILSILKNEDIDDWEFSEGDNMAEITQERFNELFLAALRSPTINTTMKALPWQCVVQAEKDGVPARSALSYFTEIQSDVNSIADKLGAETVSDAELRDALDALPTAQENAEAVVGALDGVETDELAETLRTVLGEEKAAALKAAL